MKSQKEFEKFFETTLLPKLSSTETEKELIKKRISFKKYGINVIILVCFVVFLAILKNYRPSLPDLVLGLSFFLTALYVFFAPLVIFIRRNLAYSKVDEISVKKDLVPELIEFIDSNLKYEQNGTLPAGLYDVHLVYLRTKSFPECRSSDLVSGKLDQWNIQLADTTALVGRRGGSKEDRTRLDAAYAVLELHELTHGSIYISHLNTFSAALSESMQSVESFKSQLNQIVQSVTASNRELFDDNLPEGFVLTETGHADFDKHFKIAMRENESGDKILTQDFCQNLKSVCDQTKFQIGLAIKGNQLHVAIENLNLFESDVHATSTSKEGRFSAYTWFNVFSAIKQIADLVERTNGVM
ncbi:MAG: DUF3137 domain-containing protein [Crocinitomicaceae bacterium]|nr:DUF3137 domain-containing protein [Crocinitomicaceae bacterium]MBK8927669.1 DUF3137 domain-containing protein [Crocinitomicaceae bacterium]